MEAQVLEKLKSLSSSEPQLKTCLAVFHDLHTTAQGRCVGELSVQHCRVLGQEFIYYTNGDKMFLPLYSNETVTCGKLHSLLDFFRTQDQGFKTLTLALVGQDCSVVYYELEQGISPHHFN